MPVSKLLSLCICPAVAGGLVVGTAYVTEKRVKARIEKAASPKAHKAKRQRQRRVEEPCVPGTIINFGNGVRETIDIGHGSWGYGFGGTPYISQPTIIGGGDYVSQPGGGGGFYPVPIRGGYWPGHIKPGPPSAPGKPGQPVEIPEPAALGLLGLGVAVLMKRRR